jgi:hypothetical protein
MNCPSVIPLGSSIQCGSRTANEFRAKHDLGDDPKRPLSDAEMAELRRQYGL